MLISLMRVTILNRSIIFNFFITMAKIKNTCSSTTEIVVKSILSGKNINASKVAEILLSLGLNLEQVLRASLYFTGEIEKPCPKTEVIDSKGCVLHLTDYDFLANTVRYKFSYETTRWFHSEEEANTWLADKNRYAYASASEKRDSYPFSATAEVQDSSSMPYDTWEGLASAEADTDE